MNQIYTPPQAAERLQISENKVYRLCRSGELRASKVGKLWRITETAIEEFLTPAVGADGTPTKVAALDPATARTAARQARRAARAA